MWIRWIDQSPDHGGRSSEWARTSRFWRYFADYYPVSCVLPSPSMTIYSLKLCRTMKVAMNACQGYTMLNHPRPQTFHQTGRISLATILTVRDHDVPTIHPTHNILQESLACVYIPIRLRVTGLKASQGSPRYIRHRRYILGCPYHHPRLFLHPPSLSSRTSH